MAAAMAEQMNAGIWFDRSKVEEAEEQYQEYLVKQSKPSTVETKTATQQNNKEVSAGDGNVVQQIAQARKQIQQTLKSSSSATTTSSDLQSSVDQLQQENKDLKAIVTKLQSRLDSLENRLSAVESNKGQPAAQAKPAETKPAPAAEEESSDDDDVDLFGSTDEEENEEYEKLKQKRVDAYKEKKSKKTAVVAKSTIILDVKPWSDETDVDEMEKCVRGITTEGLLWGSSKRVEVAYGIIKLQISCVVVDDLVGTDYLEEEITKFEDLVQSIDVVAFNKI